MHKTIQATLEKDERFRPFAEPAVARPVESPAGAEPHGRAPDSPDPLAELERRYDGPIPPPLREAALAGGSARLAQRRARADLRVYRALIRDSIAGIRALRLAARKGEAERSAREAALIAQLGWYRDRRRETLHHLIRHHGADTP